MSGNERERRLNRGLTLVEIVVVVTIIAVIAALLLPALIQGRRSAYRASTTSDLRQLAVALHMYMDDNGLDRPPMSAEPLRDYVGVSSVMRTAGTPWTPSQIDSLPKPSCPYLGDYVYMRYVHPLESDDGWNFWYARFGEAIPMFVSLQPSFDKLKGIPANIVGKTYGCSEYEPWMVSQSLQVVLDGSARLKKHSGTTTTYFSYSALLFL